MNVDTLAKLVSELLLLGAATWLPGLLLLRCMGLRGRFEDAVAVSMALSFNLLLLLQVFGLGLRLVPIGEALAVCTLVLFFFAKRRTSESTPAAKDDAKGFQWIWLLPAVLGVGGLLLRASLDPLSGFDHVFRWDFLARQILVHGNINFYPAVTDHDYGAYGWPDGIAPLVPFLNLLCYLPWGKALPEASLARVLIETFCLMLAIGRLATVLGGVGARWRAIALASCSAIMLWSVAMGQETGLTAFSLVLLVCHLLEGESVGVFFMAGLCAGLGGLARDYALAWIPLGLLILLILGKFRKGLVPFLAGACLVVAPWYLRNWLRTGNPLWPHSLFGLFPGDRALDEIQRIIASRYAPGAPGSSLPAALGCLALGAGFVLVAGLMAINGLARRQALALLAALLCVVSLWFISVSLTAGGEVYSLRVLSPAIALSAALGGVVLAKIPDRRVSLVAGLLSLVAADAALRSLWLPIVPFPVATNYLSQNWRTFSANIGAYYADPVWDKLVHIADGRGIFVDHPALHAAVIEHGGRALTWFNPSMRFLLEDNPGMEEPVRRLRQQGVVFVIMGRDNFITARLRSEHRLLGRLDVAARRGEILGLDLYDLREVNLANQPQHGGNRHAGR